MSPPKGMVWIPGGTFLMGSEEPEDSDARPVHSVTLDGFFMDRTEVTNRQFAQFVKETGYVTVAEQPLDPAEFPGAPLDKLVPGSLVFTPPVGRVSFDNPYVWWSYVNGANWRHPQGPESNLDGKDDFPVVQVCWEDAAAYAKWAGKRLPTEAEWEFASRGGLVGKRYMWGDTQDGESANLMNNWQGQFPAENAKSDGFARTAPVASYPPNRYGLYDMAGNVWEWCADWYLPAYKAGAAKNPQGPESSYDPNEPNVVKRIQRGGSFLCSELYCRSYRPGARGKGDPRSATEHLGFRCVLSPTDR